ncbi:MAG: helix-turn-helix domain-containing protein [Pirellulaceae bacterium]
MTVTREEILHFLDGNPIDDELRHRLSQEWDNPHSLLREIVRQEMELKRRLDRGELSWMDFEKDLPEYVDEKTIPARQTWKEARETSGLSLAQIIEKIEFEGHTDVTESDLERIEQGEEPSVLLKYTLDKVFGLIGRETQRAPVEELPVLLRQTAPATTQPATPSPITRTKVSDIQQELMDFIDPNTAQQMIAVWTTEPGELDRWVQDKKSLCSDSYQAQLLEVLALVSLKKDHALATDATDRLLQLAHENAHRRADALYLLGRQRRYVNELRESLDALLECRELCERRIFNVARLAQCYLYLSRLATQFPDQIQHSGEELTEAARQLGEQVNREDIVFLARRSEIERLHGQQRFDDEIPLAEQLIHEGLACPTMDLTYILDSVRINLGMAYRRKGTEPARRAAERQYRFATQLPRQDSHHGMCLYLQADLYVDRMNSALAQHRQSAGAGNQTDAEKHLHQAIQHHQSALVLCHQSQEELARTHDEAAKQKLAFRLKMLQQRNLAVPQDARDAVLTYATREFHIADLFFGSSRLGQDTPYTPTPEKMSLTQFEDLLAQILHGTFISRSQTGLLSAIKAADFLRPNCAICLPYLVTGTGTFEVRLLARSKDPAEQLLDNIGWLSIDKYAPLLRPYLQTYLQEPDQLFLERRNEVINTLQQQTLTVQHVAAKPNQFDHVVLLVPRTNADWVCPLEWLHTTHPITQRPCPSPLELAREGIMFTTAQHSPFLAESVHVLPNEYQVYASTQSFGPRTVFQLAADHFGSSVIPFDLASPQNPTRHTTLIVAHSDEGQLAKALDQWDFSHSTVVVLLFCSSGHHQLVLGPFFDNTAINVRQRLPSQGLVIGSRVPVQPSEAFSFADALLHSGDAPVIRMVTQYLQSRRDANPFEVPWVVLS